MKVMHRVQVVHVERDMEEVAAFVRQVPNLPQWTFFYKQVGESDGKNHAVNTVMGPAMTAIHEEHRAWVRRYTIASTFPHRVERATIELRRRGDATQVRFHLRVPRHLGQEHAVRLRGQVSQELLVLKRLLEKPEQNVPSLMERR